jgi:hypothetical protein
MAATKVTKIWTAFITVLVKFFASLGFTASAAAAQNPDTTGKRTTPFAPTPSATPLLERSLPPTMKQRIRAEAHGASPSSRQLSSDVCDALHVDPVRGTSSAAVIPAARVGRVPAACRE